MSKDKRINNLTRIVFGFLFVLCLGFFIFSANLWAVDTTDNIEKALAYLTSVQNDDGGFPADKGRPSCSMVSDWVVMALQAVGEDVTSPKWSQKGVTPRVYLQKERRSLEATTDYARTLLACTAVRSAPVWQGVDLAEKIVALQLSNGQFAQKELGEESLVNCHIWSVIALAATKKEIPKQNQVLTWLVSQQNNDGGFSWAVGGESDPDNTGVALSAFAVLGLKKEDTVIKNALQYLKKQQNEAGGWGSTKQKMNTASSAWVIQGLAAVGEDPASAKWQVGEFSPIAHLCSLQNSDGSFQWLQGVDSSPVLMTAYAVFALSGSSFPVDFNNKLDVSAQNYSLSFFNLFLDFWRGIQLLFSGIVF